VSGVQTFALPILYVPVSGIAGIRYVYRISGVQLADLVAGIVSLRRTQRQITLIHNYGIGTGRVAVLRRNRQGKNKYKDKQRRPLQKRKSVLSFHFLFHSENLLYFKIFAAHPPSPAAALNPCNYFTVIKIIDLAAERCDGTLS